MKSQGGKVGETVQGVRVWQTTYRNIEHATVSSVAVGGIAFSDAAQYIVIYEVDISEIICFAITKPTR